MARGARVRVAARDARQHEHAHLSRPPGLRTGELHAHAAELESDERCIAEGALPERWRPAISGSLERNGDVPGRCDRDDDVVTAIGAAPGVLAGARPDESAHGPGWRGVA